MERLPQTLHTYIQPYSQRGRRKQRQHAAATLLQHRQGISPASNGAQFISASSCQENCFLIEPSSVETFSNTLDNTKSERDRVSALMEGRVLVMEMELEYIKHVGAYK